MEVVWFCLFGWVGGGHSTEYFEYEHSWQCGLRPGSCWSKLMSSQKHSHFRMKHLCASKLIDDVHPGHMHRILLCERWQSSVSLWGWQLFGTVLLRCWSGDFSRVLYRNCEGHHDPLPKNLRGWNWGSHHSSSQHSFRIFYHFCHKNEGEKKKKLFSVFFHLLSFFRIVLYHRWLLTIFTNYA